MSGSGSDDYPVDEVARAWLVKLRGGDGDALRDEFDAWLQASAEHREAYRRAEKRMAALAILKTSPRHGTAHAEARRGRVRGWFAWGAAATALALLIIAIGAAGAPLPGQPGGAARAFAAEPIETQRGEIRTFQLADGSSATLDTDSRLDVAFAKDVRSVRLVRGRVRLLVARGDVPLKIEAGRGGAIANDAEIDLSLDAAGTVVASLRRGAAEMRADGGSDEAKRVEAGSALAYGPGKRLAPVAAPATVIPAGWPAGWADYRSIRLSALVAETNRYAAVPIVIDDSAIAAREVSGRFHISETEAFAERIAMLLDLAVDRRADAIHLSRR